MNFILLFSLQIHTCMYSQCEQLQYKYTTQLFCILYVGTRNRRTFSKHLLTNLIHFIQTVNTADPLESNDRVVEVSSVRKEVCQDILCDFEGTCETGPDGLPRCACIFDCSLEPEKLVCGSDLQMYSSVCHMKMKSCQKQEEIRLRPIELCRGT